MPTHKNFSVEEANALLPQIESLLIRLVRKKESMDRKHDELFMNELLQEAAPLRPASAGRENAGPLDSVGREVDASFSELESELALIRSLGCILRNLDAGWVEFPSLLEGNSIYLCWKRGESAIGFYRRTHASFAERLPLL